MVLVVRRFYHSCMIAFTLRSSLPSVHLASPYLIKPLPTHKDKSEGVAFVIRGNDSFLHYIFIHTTLNNEGNEKEEKKAEDGPGGQVELTRGRSVT